MNNNNVNGTEYHEHVARYKEFSNQFFIYANKIYCKENVVISAYSVYVLLALLANISSRNTRYEIFESLSCESLDDLNNTISMLQEMFSFDEKKTAFEVTNEILFGTRFKAHISLNTNILERLKSIFNVKVGFVEDEKIQLGVVNRVRFKSFWKDNYEDCQIIKERHFNNYDGTMAMVTMLSSTERYYIEDDYFTGVIKPYGDRFSFVALLPKETEIICEHELNTIDFSEYCRNSMKLDVITNIPEFSFDFEMDLIPFLRSIGINEAMTLNADFSDILEEQNFNEIIVMQNAQIEVDSVGTKAEAKTEYYLSYAECYYVDEIPCKYVTLDRPFIYAIVSNQNYVPLFVGSVNKL